MYKKKYLTAPIYYVNGEPHIGHLYTSFAVDILAKFEKLLSNDVFTSYGTDEHGQKVQLAAGDKNPQEYVDEAHLKFKELLKCSAIEANCFIRTTDDLHKKTAIHLWDLLCESGKVYNGTYSGWYSKRDESYYKEDEVENGLAKETGSPVEFVEEECIFFRLSATKDLLLNYYEQNQDVIKPKARYAEVLQLIKSDLPDLAISRSRFSWGIPVPGQKKQVMYVWVDALSNYLSAIGYPRNTDYNLWWSNVIHIIGKDILKFHAIYWPAILLTIGIDPPKKIFAHGWWKVNEEKMSKSVGNVVEPFALIEKYGADQIRYYMFREATFGNDCNFSIESLEKMINSELSNELGNLVQRTLAFCSKKYGTTIECPFEIINPSKDEILFSIERLCEIEYKYKYDEEEPELERESISIQEDMVEPKQTEDKNASNYQLVPVNEFSEENASRWRFGNTVRKYWKEVCGFFSVNDSEEEQKISESKNDEQKAPPIDKEASLQILREWDMALLDSAKFIEEQHITGYVNRLREAIIKTNRYVDVQSPWKQLDPKPVLGVLCSCIQRLAILAYPIIPTKSKEVLSLLGISQPTVWNWIKDGSFPVYNPKPLFEKIK